MGYDFANPAEIPASPLGAMRRTLGCWNGSKRIVTFGDSFDDTYGYNNTSLLLERRSAGGMTWFMRLSGQQFEYHNELNFAVGGHTTTQQLAIAEAALDATMPGLAVWGAGTNDNANTAQEVPASVTIANDKAFVKLCQDRGTLCFLRSISPRGGWTDSPDAATAKKRRQRIQAVNLFRQALARRHPGVFYVDTWAWWANAASSDGNPRTGVVRGDGLHPSDGEGGYYLGLALWLAVQDAGFVYQPPSRNNAVPITVGYDATENPWGNRLYNPSLNDTSGTAGTGVTGTIPGFFSCSRNSGSVATAVGAQVARPDDAPGNVQSLAITIPSTAAANQQFQFQQGTTFDVTPGETIQAMMAYWITSMKGARVPQLRLQFLASDNTTGVFDARDGDATGAMPDGATHFGVMAIDPTVVPAGAAKAKLTAYLTVYGDSTDNNLTVLLGDAFAGRVFTEEELQVIA